jgi:hypothetical protein
MKTFFLTTGLLITASLLFPGCKKDKDEEPPVPPKPVCRTLTITESSVTASFVYDANKKVSRVAYSDGTIEDYTYKGDTTKILRTTSGAFEFRKIITNNADGMATQVRIEDNAAGTSGLIISYVYNGTELIQEVQKPIGSATTTVTIYTWTAGNLTELKSGTSVTTLDYYNNKESQLGNYLEAVNVSQGYNIFKTKNLVKRITQSGTATEITYTFNADNNITSAVFSGSSSALLFTYQCD